MAESSKAPVVFQPWRDPNETPYVSIERVTKKFGDFVAVYELSLDIYRKELFCLLGASGCGKSTLLRMLAGFEQPTSGRILIDGMDMADIPPYERPVNMMFQSYALFPHMNVEQNVAFGLKQEKLPGSVVRERTQEMLALVKLDTFAKRKPHQLSGGQRQRVALARSLVKKPKLLLLDEPLAALDKKLREHTQFELMNIQDQVGVTFIVVTHDQQEAMTLSTRIGVMDEGELIQVGTPTDIYEFPQSRYVADFIGSVNIFAGKMIVDEPDHVVIHSREAGIDVFVNHGVSAGPDADVWAAIRPEKIHISREDPAREQNCVRGIVDEVAYMGDFSTYLVKLETGKIVRITQPNLLRGNPERILWDEPVYIYWDASSPVVVTK
ncbi:MAG: polyamine ABC transporter ATP-binding protein [Gammaproteobacteria bacterium]